MAVERTLGIIKPDAVANGYIGKVLDRIAEEGFTVCGMKMVRLTRKQAEGFYHVHVGKPFFDALTEFMSSGPCVLLALEREGAIGHWRAVMGATDPAKADAGTLRKLYAESMSRNAVHGSDAPETAAFEIGYFFNTAFELVG